MSKVASIGLWSRAVMQLEVPSLQEISSVELSGEFIPRSCLRCAMDSETYLLVGLGGGQLHSWRVDPSSGLTNKQEVTLGTKPISLQRCVCMEGGREGYYCEVQHNSIYRRQAKE
jgi:hypothetical protein